MARTQFPGPSTLTVDFFIIVMATQFSIASAWQLKFDIENIDALVGSSFNLTCTLNPDYATELNANSSHLEIFLEYIGNNNYIPIAEDHIRIFNDSSIQLHYTHLPNEFVNRLQFITCFEKHRNRTIRTVSTSIEVKKRHKGRPRVRPIHVDNWDELHVGWEPVKETDKHFKMSYEMWYRNDSSTPTVFTKSENCDGHICVIIDPFSRTFPGEVLVLKVNGSVKTEFSQGILEEATSQEVRVNLTEYLRPRKIDHINIIQNQSTKILIFKPPKTNQNIRYDINVNCTKFNLIQSKIITRSVLSDFNNATNSDGNSKEMWVTEPLVGLPPYANCTAFIRSISVNGGKWSEWKHHDFQTLQDVPLAVPQSCRCCFQVLETDVESLFHVIVYFTPLTEEEARGRVELYRIKMIENGALDNNATELRPDPLHFSSFLLNNLSNEIDYKINFEVKTQSGYNETLDLSPSTILVPQSKLRPNSSSHKFIVVILNETSIRATLEMKDRSGINKMFLFWCEGSVERERPCQDVLKWKEFSIDSTKSVIDITYIIHLEKSHRYFLFGSGIEDNRKSSGITWSSCTYDIRSSPPKTIIESHRRTSSDVYISLHEPSCQKISEERGFVIGYRLFFCPLLHSSDSTNERRCVDDEMRSLEFHGQQQILNLNELIPNRTYLILISSLSERKTSSNVTLEVTTNPVDDSLLPTLIIIFACVAVFVISALIVCLKRMSFRRFIKGVPIIVPPVITQEKPPPQLVDDVGYRLHLLGIADSFSSKRVESSISIDTLTTIPSPPQSPEFFVFSPKVTFSQRSDSGIEATTPLETILPPLTGFLPSVGVKEEVIPCEGQSFAEDGNKWDVSSEWNPKKPVLSVHSCFTSNDHRLSVSDVVSDYSGGYGPQCLDGYGPQYLDGSESQCLDGSTPLCLDGSRTQCLDGSRPLCLDGSGYAFCQQNTAIVLLPAPSGEAQPVTFNSSTSYSSNSSSDTEDDSSSCASDEGLVVYHLSNNFTCSTTSQAIPTGSEEPDLNEGFQTEDNNYSRQMDDGDQTRNLQQNFSDYSSVTFDKSV